MEKQFLKELLLTSSPCGNEMLFQKKVMKFAEEFADEVSYDSAANVYATIGKDNSYKVMLAAHSDEIGLRVISIENNGYLKVIKTGGVSYPMYLGHQVRVFNGKEFIYGAIVANNDLYEKKVKAEDIFVDIGASSKQEAEKYVKHGDHVLFNNDYCELLENKIASRALDDKSGVFVIFEALKRAKQLQPKVCVTSVSTTNEETGSKGAYYASNKIKPDIAIAVDVTYASDFPGSATGDTGKVLLGHGPVIDNGCTLNRILNKRIAKVAKENNISVQYELTAGYTGTDEKQIQLTNLGVPTAIISIPLRNMHSPAEVISYKDLEDCIELIAQFVSSIEENGIDLDPFKE